MDFKFDENGLYLGDCLEQYHKNIERNSIDLILTDLPYGTTACKWDTIIPFDKLWEMVNYLLKPNGTFITTASQPFTSALIMSNPNKFKYALVWNKSRNFGVMHAKNMPLKKHEDILVFSNGIVAHKGQNKRMTYNPIMQEGKPYNKLVTRKQLASTDHNLIRPSLNDLYIENKGERYPNTVISIPFGNQNLIHPTQKPVALMEYLIRTYSNEFDFVFDPCAGSGTVAIACENTNRNHFSFEKDSEMCLKAQQRLEEHIKQRRA
jgi:site-specific DNA-methyltransferase (adenine-specific)